MQDLSQACTEDIGKEHMTTGHLPKDFACHDHPDTH